MNKFVVALAKMVKVILRPFYPYKVFGNKDVEYKKCVVVGNHISALDPLVYNMHTKGITPVVYKVELAQNRLLRRLLDGLECVPVRRGEADINATKCVLRLLRSDRPVQISPEGTRNPNVDCFLKFHTGAALFALKTRAPIRPYYLWDKAKVFTKNYMIIGEEFTLEQFYDRPIDHDTLEEATEYIKSKLNDLRLQLNGILAERGVKRRPRTKKEMEQIIAYNDSQRALAQQAAAAEAVSEDALDGQSTETEATATISNETSSGDDK